MMAWSGLSGRSEFSPVIIRTDFTDEVAWQETTAELERSPFHDGGPAQSYDVVDAPELDGADTDAVLAAISAHETLWEQLSVVFVADSTTMRAGRHALLAVTTMTREDFDDDEATVEYGRAFRTLPSGVHPIHVNLELANADFEEFSSSAHEDSEGVFRFFAER
ncbi:DUF6924 domain-containing protein [Streptomyces coelicoflavus]|uniref:DUF6924 domain-containing protein n=1 Tax=Streptomyces TaxID=1883 RepID=UPI0012915A0C|nr:MULTISPECIES: hypothetical protein [unclassified Streptomyces]QFX86686.1 hypothetical protein GEV49_38025 [Streptomyces sp. SYP-A7193]